MLYMTRQKKCIWRSRSLRTDYESDANWVRFCDVTTTLPFFVVKQYYQTQRTNWPFFHTWCVTRESTLLQAKSDVLERENLHQIRDFQGSTCSRWQCKDNMLLNPSLALPIYRVHWDPNKIFRERERFAVWVRSSNAVSPDPLPLLLRSDVYPGVRYAESKVVAF